MHPSHTAPHPASVDADATAVDPVCGMTIDKTTAKHTAEHEGRTCYFCCDGCRATFLADPARYQGNDNTHGRGPSHDRGHAQIRATATAQAPSGEPVIWTCPMHPDVRKASPGSCPKCGMALEPLVVTAAAPRNPELASMARRFWICLPLAAAVLVIAMALPLAPVWIELLSPHGAYKRIGNL